MKMAMKMAPRNRTVVQTFTGFQMLCKINNTGWSSYERRVCILQAACECTFNYFQRSKILTK